MRKELKELVAKLGWQKALEEHYGMQAKSYW
jgi:hypothetical protein